MPVGPDYSIPSWIHGVNPLSAVESGASLGLRIAESNQRAAIAYAEMQRRQQEFQQQMEMKQQQLEQQKAIQQQMFQDKQLYEQQKLQIDNSYKQGQLNLKKQQLDQIKNAAAEKANASGRFLQSLNTLTTGYIAEEGMTEEQARAKAMPQALFDSGMFQYMNPSALSQMVKSLGGQEAQWRTSPSGLPYAQEPSGNIRFEPRPVPNPVMAAQIGDITSNIRALDKQFREEPNQEKRGKIEDELIRLSEQRSAMQKGTRQQPPTAQAQTDASPAAAPKTIRVKSPDGQTGTIPSDQLDAAKAQGYTELE